MRLCLLVTVERESGLWRLMVGALERMQERRRGGQGSSAVSQAAGEGAEHMGVLSLFESWRQCPDGGCFSGYKEAGPSRPGSQGGESGPEERFGQRTGSLVQVQEAHWVDCDRPAGRD